MNHPDELPSLLLADEKGDIFDYPPLGMAGMSNRNYSQPHLSDLIPLPEGSELFTLPGRLPIGCDRDSGEPLLVENNPFYEKQSIQAVAAFMSPAHTTILNGAYKTIGKKPPLLPLFAYTAVGWYKGKFWVAGFRSDNDIRQDANQFNGSEIERKTKKQLLKYKNNLLIQHLGKCCLTYGCPAARNYFLGRWEAPLPTSPVCNASCIGCISLQPAGCCLSTQERITFVPTPVEISEMAIAHLQSAPKAIVSFGQGCEGEPLLQADTIEASIQLIRQATNKGTINLNSNASLPNSIEKLAKAGLDSLRVSINSLQPSLYRAYYRPKNYDFVDVIESIKRMKGAGGFVSLNYFILPGVTDSIQEFEALSDLLQECSPDLIQLRNLNMDPEWYLDSIQFSKNNKAMGITNWFNLLQKNFPTLQFGYFNPYLGL